MIENKVLNAEEWVKGFKPGETSPSTTIKRTYNDNLVAFIDVLGTTDLIKRKDAEEILTLMGEIQKYVKAECEPLEARHKLSYLQVGDGFVIVMGLGYLNTLCRILSIIQWKTLIYSKKLIRGALTAGEVVVDGNLFIGPAIIEAYKLERQNAIFPRIIYTGEIEKYIKKPTTMFDYITEDQDKAKYIDYIKYNFDVRKLSTTSLDQLLIDQGTKNILKDEYQLYSSKKDSEFLKRAQKYGWLISKFSSHGIRII